MSTSSTAVTPEINALLQELFNSEDAFLRTLNEDAAAAGIPAISIAPEQTRFLQVILKAINAEVVLEIGSLAGYSTIAMARALPEHGQLFAFEIEPMHAAFIEKKVAAARFDHIISVEQGAALDNLPNVIATLQEQHNTQTPIDAVFIDADKPNYENYLNLVLPAVRRGGLVMGDNALAFGYIASEPPAEEADNVAALRAFNRSMSSHPALLSTLVPLGDGIVIGVVR
jgi:caffeoyl-CoA O-methyltransferase